MWCIKDIFLTIFLFIILKVLIILKKIITPLEKKMCVDSFLSNLSTQTTTVKNNKNNGVKSDVFNALKKVIIFTQN